MFEVTRMVLRWEEGEKDKKDISGEAISGLRFNEKSWSLNWGSTTSGWIAAVRRKESQLQIEITADLFFFKSCNTRNNAGWALPGWGQLCSKGLGVSQTANWTRASSVPWQQRKPPAYWAVSTGAQAAERGITPPSRCTHEAVPATLHLLREAPQDQGDIDTPGWVQGRVVGDWSAHPAWRGQENGPCSARRREGKRELVQQEGKLSVATNTEHYLTHASLGFFAKYFCGSYCCKILTGEKISSHNPCKGLTYQAFGYVVMDFSPFSFSVYTRISSLDLRFPVNSFLKIRRGILH